MIVIVLMIVLVLNFNLFNIISISIGIGVFVSIGILIYHIEHKRYLKDLSKSTTKYISGYVEITESIKGWISEPPIRSLRCLEMQDIPGIN